MAPTTDPPTIPADLLRQATCNAVVDPTWSEAEAAAEIVRVWTDHPDMAGNCVLHYTLGVVQTLICEARLTGEDHLLRRAQATMALGVAMWRSEVTA